MIQISEYDKVLEMLGRKEREVSELDKENVELRKLILELKGQIDRKKYNGLVSGFGLFEALKKPNVFK